MKNLTNFKKLAEKTKASNLRFWGKIFGTQADYYVAEGRVSDEFADAIPDKTYEPAGVGVNRMTYWVTNSGILFTLVYKFQYVRFFGLVLEDWKQLPLISPAQVAAARQIKHYFTGNLNAKLNTYPAFPGLEKHYVSNMLTLREITTFLIAQSPNCQNYPFDRTGSKGTVQTQRRERG